MQHCPGCLGAAKHFKRSYWGRKIACALAFLAPVLVWTLQTVAQNSLPPAMEATGPDPGAPPMSMSESADVSFFSQDLGTILRLRFNTESYGQDGNGNFDIGSMQVVTMDDTAAFLDGQVTMNESDGVGFNIGLGYRWMSYPFYSAESGRMEGVSLWADGMHTNAGNFFPQVGVSYESLGELWDVRANGYIPLGEREQVGTFKPLNTIGFLGNSLDILSQATVDRSFYAADVEFARRMGPDRDAWAFAGPYFVGNDSDNSAGVRVGMRGYAYPDLLLQVALSDDDVFKTTATFSVVWFVGRTRTNFHPACAPADRMREPVMRNDYVVLSHTKRMGGTALTAANGSALRFVHVDSNAAPGGDGTFEHPFDMLTDANGTGSQKGDIIFAHSTSVFTGDQSLVLKDNQKLFGEGNNMLLTVSTTQKGTVTIPESSPGARALARPMILAAVGDAVVLADNNEVTNFDIDGQNVTTRAIAAPATGAGNPNIHDLSIKNTTGDGIFFKPEDFIDTNDVNGNGNTTERIVRGNVTVKNVTFNGIGGNGLDIDSGTAVDVTLPNVVLQETIGITNVTSTNGNGVGINIENTHTGTGHATTLTGYTYNGGTTSAGGIRLNNFNGSFTGSSSTLTNGATSGNGAQVLGNSDGAITFQNTFVFNNVGGTALLIDGDFGGADQINGNITVDGAITKTNNNTGHSVLVQGIGTGAIVSIDGKVTDRGEGVLVQSNAGGSVLFIGDVDVALDTPGTAIKLDTNPGTSIDFAGKVVINNPTGSIADGFVATGGGSLSVPGTVNSISVDTGQALKITGMTIDTVGVNFGDVNRPGASALSAIQLETNTGGPITVGNTTDTVGQAGTITSGTNEAIRITDSANVSITGLIVKNTAGAAGATVTTANNAMTVNLSDLQVDDGAIGVQTVGGGTGALTMTTNDTTINRSTAEGMLFNNVDAGTVHVNNATIDGNNANATARGVVINDSDATITFDTATAIRKFSGTDFEVAGGKGAISFAGDIDNTDGVGNSGHSVHVHNVTGGSVSFASDNSINDTNLGILVENNTGGTIGFNGDYTLNTGASDAVRITNNTGATVSIGNLNIDTTGGQGFVATGGGTLNVVGFNNTITRTAGGVTGSALDIENMTIGAVDFESVNSTDGVNGVRTVDNTGGTITIGDTGNLAGQGGTISGTTDSGVHAQNTNLTLNGVTVQNAGDAAGENAVEIFHTNATAMNTAINRLTVNNATAARDGVVIDGSGGSGTFNADVENLAVNVTGDGLVANNGVTLTAGGTNTITSATGIGLQLTNIAVAPVGASFQSVNVTNGASNGIKLQNVTGGQVAVTGTGATGASGGILTTTTGSDAIVLNNVQNVDLKNIQIANSGAMGLNIDHTSTATTTMDVTIDNLNLITSAGAGIDVLSASNTQQFNLRLLNSTVDERVAMSHTGTNAFEVLLDNDTIAATGNDVALAFSFTGAAQDGDITIRNGTSVTAVTGSALSFTATTANADVEFASDGSTFTNNSGTSTAAKFLVNNGAELNANITNNSFSNPGAAAAFAMTSDGMTTHINLDLNGNTSNDTYELTTMNQGVAGTDFNFSVVNRNTTDANNAGTVNFNPAIGDFENIPGPVESPSVP